MSLRWTAVGLGALAVLAMAALLHFGGLLQPRDIVIGVLNHGAIAEQSLEGFKAALPQYGYGDGARVTYLYRGPLQGEALEEESRRLAALRP
ncbi:MAG: ABC transporter, partial [Rhodospirillaceae bacterium]|nr:ABC transporter [Rhodospirillaceae bacterium]